MNNVLIIMLLVHFLITFQLCVQQMQATIPNSCDPGDINGLILYRVDGTCNSLTFNPKKVQLDRIGKYVTLVICTTLADYSIKKHLEFSNKTNLLLSFC